MTTTKKSGGTRTPRRLGLRLLMGAASILAALTVSGTVFAAIPDANDVVHGCYSNGVTKALFLVDNPPNYTCPVGMSKVSLLGAGGGGGFIENTMTQQAGANFNIGGFGAIGGNLTVQGHISASSYLIGGQTALQASDASGDVVVGPLAGGLTAGDNTVMGVSSMAAGGTGGGNEAFGYLSLYSDSTGNNNVANGFEALYKNTTGNMNIAMGTSALALNTTGSYNIGLGTQALTFNKVGSKNIAIGLQTLGESNGADSNTAIGYTAMQLDGTGSQNAAMGALALYNNSSGNDNAGFGEEALSGNTQGSFNSALGYQAGQHEITGQDDLFLGADSGPTVNTFLNNATAVGANAVVSADNSLVLGHNANVGIGTATPHSTLQVVGGFLQLPTISSGPPASGCSSSADAGRMTYSTTDDHLWICDGTTWHAH